jgi:hypothetical protein
MTRLLILVMAAAALLSACSFSASSKSSSTSSGSISDSASSPSSLVSSGKKDKQESYQADIRDYTAEFVRAAGGNLEDFQVRMGKIAEAYGVAQWQEDRATYVAIGKGLRKAALSPPQYAAFKASLGEGVGWKMDAIAEGYR